MATEEKKVIYKLEFQTGELDKKLKQLNTEISALNNARKESKKLNGEDSKEYAVLTQRLKEQKQEYNKISKAIISTNKIRSQETGYIEKLKAQLQLTAAQINKLTEAELKDARVGGALLKTKKQLTEELYKIEKYTGQYGRNVGNYTSVWGKLGSAIKFAATQLSIFFGVTALIRGFKNIINNVKDFTQSVAVLQSVLGATKSEMKELNDLALELGRTTKYTASEVINLQEALARLGFNSDEIKDMTLSILNLATALNTDLKSSAELVGATLRAFQMETEQSTHVSDLFAQATRRSALSFEKLSVALPIVGTVAKNAGVSLESLLSQLGVLADRGMDASMAATALRKVYLSLAKSGMSYEEALERINNAADKNKESLKLFGVRAATVGTILATSAEDVDKLSKALDDAGGATKEMADIQMNTLEGALLRVKSAWEAFILNLDKSTGFSDKLKNTLNFLAENLTNIMHTVWEVTKAFIALKTAQIGLSVIQGLITAYKTFTYVLKSAEVAQLALNKAQLKNVYTAVAAAVLYLGEKLYEYVTSLTKAEQAQKDFNEELSKTLGESESLFWQLENTTKGTKEYADILSRINEKYGEYLPFLLDEKSSLEEIEKARNIVNESIEETIRLRILEQNRTDIYTKKVKETIDADKEYRQTLIDKKILTEEQIRIMKETINEQAKITDNIYDYQKAIEKAIGKEIKWKDVQAFHTKENEIFKYLKTLKGAAREAESQFSELEKIFGSGKKKPLFNFYVENEPTTPTDDTDGDPIISKYNKQLNQSLVNLQKYKIEYDKIMKESATKGTDIINKQIESINTLRDKQLTVEYQRYIDSKQKLKEKLDADKITEEDYNNEKSILYQKYLIKKEELEIAAQNKIDDIRAKELEKIKKIEQDKLNLDKKMLDIRLKLGKISEQEYSDEITKIRLKLLRDTNEYKRANIEQQKLMEQNIIITEEDRLTKIEYNLAKKRIETKYKYTKGLEKEYAKEMIALEIEYLKKSKDYAIMNEIEKQEAINEIKRQYLVKSKDIQEESFTFLNISISEHISQLQEVIGLINDLLGNIIANIQQLANKEIETLREKYDIEKNIRRNAYNEELADLEYKYQTGQITEQQYLKQKYNAQVEYDKKILAAKKIQQQKEKAIQEQTLEQQKKYQIAQVLLNTAAAIMKVWNNTIPQPAGSIYAAAQSAIIAAISAIQIGTIQKQKMASGGLLSGPLHTQGGIDIGSYELEGNEYIINRAATERYKPLLDVINESGNATGNSGAVKDIIDYSKLINGLATVINDKKVILTQRDLVEDENIRVNIQNRTTF